MKQTKYFFAILVGAAVVAASCSDRDDYNTAYIGDAAGSNETLWENISSNESLTEFAELLEKVGYDDKLSASQFYTVWAPEDGTFGYDTLITKDSAWLDQRFIQSHVAYYNYQVSGEVDERIHTLNEKSFEFVGNSSSCTYDGNLLTACNLPSINGTLHTIDGCAVYFPNLYEYIFELPNCDSISTYIGNYESSYLDESSSVEGPIVDGNQTYSDSVMVTINTLMQQINAQLDDEDSSYTVLLPNDEAFVKAIDAISPVYNYASTTQYYEISRSGTNNVSFSQLSLTVDDELQDSLARRCIVDNMVFSHNDTYNAIVFDNTAPEGLDTLRSTRRNKLSNGYELLSYGDSPIEASNGYVRVVDTLAFHPWEVWNPEINISSVEITAYATSASGTLNVVDSVSGEIITTYYNAVPSTTGSNTAVYYMLNNVRAASYNVYVVFVSLGKPYKFQVAINYADASGTVSGTSSFPFTTSSSPTSAMTNESTYNLDPYGIDTCYIGEVTFPISYVGLDCAPYMMVRSLRSTLIAGDTDTYDNNLRIAGVILRPVEYDEYLNKEEE